MIRRASIATAAEVAAAVASSAVGQVYPDHPHGGWNSIPFWTDQCTFQQAFAAEQFGSAPIEIRSLAFAPSPTHDGEDFNFDQLSIRLGYTDKDPGELSSDLSVNPRGSMTEVFNEVNCYGVIEYGGGDYFSLVFTFAAPLCYDPANGNLLVEFYNVNTLIGISVSCSSGLPDASRAWNSLMFGNGADTTAARMMFDITSCSSGLTLALGGRCPGQINIAWSNAAPGRPMGIVYARDAGSFSVPGGPCAGTRLGLGSNQIQLVRSTNTGSGSGSVNGNAGPGACGGFVQLVVVDGSPCATSNVMQLR